MREFVDSQGVKWWVGVKALPGQDYKGRYVFAARPLSGGAPSGAGPSAATSIGSAGGAEVLLDDVRWNSEKTAMRTIGTMSAVELERRIAWARGRA